MVTASRGVNYRRGVKIARFSANKQARSQLCDQLGWHAPPTTNYLCPHETAAPVPLKTPINRMNKHVYNVFTSAKGVIKYAPFVSVSDCQRDLRHTHNVVNVRSQLGLMNGFAENFLRRFDMDGPCALFNMDAQFPCPTRKPSDTVTQCRKLGITGVGIAVCIRWDPLCV